MKRRLAVLALALLGAAAWWCGRAGGLAQLQAAAWQVRKLENVSQRTHVHVFYDLADAYAREGRDAERLHELAHALTLDPGNGARQVEAARLEIADGRHDDAHERLVSVREGGTREERAAADAVLDELRARGHTPKALAPPRVVDRWVVLVGFRDTERGLVEDLAKRVGAAFGVRTRVHETVLDADRTGARDAAWAPGGVQLEADRLVAQLTRSTAPLAADPTVLAVVGVTGTDLYAGPLNFLFGTAADRVGVFSLSRFSRPGDARETVLSRATKQAFSTTGFTLGVPRCSSSACARAYPHSLAEMDRKGHALCRECRGRLDVALGRGR